VLLTYRYAHGSDGVNGSAFLQSHAVIEALPWSIAFLLLSLTVSAILHGVSTFEKAEFPYPAKKP